MNSLLTTRELAEALNISPETVKHWGAGVPRVRVSKRSVRYRVDDVLRYWKNAPPWNESIEEREVRYAAEGESMEHRDARHAAEKESVERLLAQIYGPANRWLMEQEPDHPGDGDDVGATCK